MSGGARGAEVMVPDRWEAGSDYALPVDILPGSEAGTGAAWAADRALFRSGRDALAGLMKHGRDERGWKRLWVPSYFCHEVLRRVRVSGMAVGTYPASPVHPPELDPGIFAPGDALLTVDYFGTGRWSAPGGGKLPVEVIEDHTHDPWSPWSVTTNADYAFASLRKVLPLPDGAALWSPRGHAVPRPEPGGGRDPASMLKVAGMLLKGRYLRGYAVDKAAYLTLLAEGEAAFADDGEQAMSRWSMQLLYAWPIEAWRHAREANHDRLVSLIPDRETVRVFTRDRPPGHAPFSVVLLFRDAAAAGATRSALMAERIYPAVLWPFAQDRPGASRREDLDLSRRLLSIHCDGRYGDDDMDRIAAVLRRTWS